MSFKKKLENYWYHYKFVTLIWAAIILAAIFGVSCFLLLPFPLFIGALIANITVGGWVTAITVLLGINVLLMFIVWVLVSGSQHLPFSTPFLYPVLFGNLGGAAAAIGSFLPIRIPIACCSM